MDVMGGRTNRGLMGEQLGHSTEGTRTINRASRTLGKTRDDVEGSYMAKANTRTHTHMAKANTHTHTHTHANTHTSAGTGRWKAR